MDYWQEIRKEAHQQGGWWGVRSGHLVESYGVEVALWGEDKEAELLVLLGEPDRGLRTRATGSSRVKQGIR